MAGFPAPPPALPAPVGVVGLSVPEPPHAPVETSNARSHRRVMAEVYNNDPGMCHMSSIASCEVAASIGTRDIVRPFVPYLTRIFFVFALAAGASGCVVVRAHEREHLAKRGMTNDRDVGEARFGQHERGAREGADGGTGEPGGGCGCN